MNVNLRDDIQLVQNARRNAYIKNSEITVGAVVKTKSGRKYTGCNIEINSNEILCAEKVAIAKAMSEGEREFDYIIVTAGKKSQPSEKYLPNEECREFIKSLVDDNFKLYNLYENQIDKYKFIDILN